MKNFEAKISQSINRNQLITESDAPVIVTLSGGADSVALASALVALGYNCVAAHCNFHLRGDESDRDQQHAQDIAKALGIPCYTVHFDVAGQQARTGESVEMACRTLRYDYFERLRSEIGAQAIAVAHHRDDNAETMMLNMLRGTGIAGLTGMEPKRGYIVRPMLDCTRSEIEQYLHECGLPYVTDSTNLSNDYRRNKIRNRILPSINEEFPDSAESIKSTMDVLREQYRFYNRMISRLATVYRLPSGDIDLQRLVSNEPDAELLIYEWLKEYGINRRQAYDIVTCAGKSGRRFDSHGISYMTDRGILRTMARISPDPFDLSRLSVSLTDADGFQPGNDPFTIYLDAESAGSSPAFHIRPWQSGDRIRPFGMTGSRKLSDIFSDAKVPVDIKPLIPVVTLGSDVIWVVGLRASRLHSITPSTRKVLSVTYHADSGQWITQRPRR